MDADLVAYARDAAARGDDLFALLSTDATSSESDIRRAFRKKALTAHPDKAGDAYDPALYERLERARDVLTNPDARKAYDDGMRAVLQKKAQLEQMTSRRRKLVEELELREQEAKRAKTDAAQAAVQRDAEREAMAARGRAKLEERRRLMREAEERERLAQQRAAPQKVPEAPPPRQPKPKSESGRAASPAAAAATATAEATATDEYDERIAELERRIKEKQERKAAKKAKKAGIKQASPPPSPPDPLSSRTNGTAEADALKQPSDAGPAPVPATQPPPEQPSIPHRPSAPADTPPPQSRGSKFAATMARLKAAQARRDEEKRRRAEEAAAAATEAEGLHTS